MRLVFLASRNLGIWRGGGSGGSGGGFDFVYVILLWGWGWSMALFLVWGFVGSVLVYLHIYCLLRDSSHVLRFVVGVCLLNG